MTNTATTRPARSKLLPLVALGIAAAAGGTALGLPLPQAAQAAPGDEIDAGTFDLGTLAEGEELPGGGGGVSSLDLTAYGVPAGTVLTEPGAPIEIRSNADGTLAWSWVGADVVGQLGYGPMSYSVSIAAPDETVIAVRFTWDWSAAAPEEPEEPEEPAWEAPDLRARMASGSTDHCVAGALRVPLTSGTYGQDLDGLTFDGFEPNDSTEVPFADDVRIDGHDLVFVGYDPAKRADGETGTQTLIGGTTVASNADGETDDATISGTLAAWCGTSTTVKANADGAYEVLLEALFTNLTSPGNLHFDRDGGIGAAVEFEALPTPEQGQLLAFDAAGNQLDITPATEWWGPRAPGTTHRLVFVPAEGADPTGFELVVGLHSQKAATPAPVTVAFEPAPEVPEEPTPEEPEPETPEPETPEPVEPTPEEPEEPEPTPQPQSPVKPPRVTE